MKIQSVRCWLEKIPLTKPYTIAYDTFDHTEIVFLEMQLENGLKGLGSANPFEEVVGETPQQTLHNLQEGFLEEFIVGKNIADIDSLIETATQKFNNYPGTLAAIDIALHDCWAQFLGKPLVDLLGVRSGPLPTSMTIGIKDTAEMIRDAADYLAQGFRVLKIKTGINVEQDIERITALHSRFKDQLRLRVDANEGYTIEQLSKFLKKTEHCAVELIEQPLPAGKEELLSPRINSVKLAADESLINEQSAIQLTCVPRPFDIFNVKLMKCGGIAVAKKIMHIAENAGIELFWGCNDESAVSLAAALHLAYSSPNTKYLDLDGSFDLTRDAVNKAFELKDGMLYITGENGLGLIY